MGYRNPVWHNGTEPSINDERLNDLCYTVERLDFADGRVVVGQKEGETLGNYVTSEGYNTVSSGNSCHSEGAFTVSRGNNSHAEGFYAQALDNSAHAEGNHTVAQGKYSHAEGYYSESHGEGSHAEGNSTVTYGDYSHTEGSGTSAIGLYAHSEGSGSKTLTVTINGPISANATTYAVGASESDRFSVGAVLMAKINDESDFTSASAKVESKTSTTITVSETLNPDIALTGNETLGIYTIDGVSFGIDSHSEGLKTIASGDSSHAEGSGSIARGTGSHCEGHGTIAEGSYQHVFGQYNTSNSTDVEIVGWGTSSTRKNIRTLDNNGNMTIAGTLSQNSDAKLKTVSGEVPDVSGIHAVRFRWNDVNGQHDDDDHVGYIAQDVEKVAPFMVKNDSNGYKTLDYIALLCAKVEMLERKVKELEER